MLDGLCNMSLYHRVDVDIAIVVLLGLTVALQADL